MAKDMATGIENTGAQSLLQNSVLAQLAQQSGLTRATANSTNSDNANKDNALNTLIDRLDLSPEALRSLQANQDALNTLSAGRGELEQQARDSLGAQLAQIQEA